VTVRVLGTGGTIAASIEGDAIRYLAVADLCGALPSVLPSMEAVDLERVASSALQASDMLAIAHEVRRSLRAGIEGVVVTQGTDTLEETAFLTDLLVGDDSDLGGVVFTGAMRFASHISPDGPGNLSDAVRLAACPAARGLGCAGRLWRGDPCRPIGLKGNHLGPPTLCLTERCDRSNRRA
jgi:L-asparaginase